MNIFKIHSYQKNGLKPVLLRRFYIAPFGVEGYGCPSFGDMVVSIFPFRVKRRTEPFDYAQDKLRRSVRFANVIRACWAQSTVPVTLELFN